MGRAARNWFEYNGLEIFYHWSGSAYWDMKGVTVGRRRIAVGEGFYRTASRRYKRLMNGDRENLGKRKGVWAVRQGFMLQWYDGRERRKGCSMVTENSTLRQKEIETMGMINPF